jgi:hypothetical protein
MRKLHWMNLLLWAVWAIVWRPLATMDPEAGSRPYLFVAIVPPAFAYLVALFIAWAIRRFNRRSQPDLQPKI